jgi:ParB/RepB/Spo0J family partition protein
MILQVIDRTQIDFGDRRRDDYGNLEQLANSIKEKGLIQPIAVWQRPTPLAEGELPYLLLAGGRRFNATFIIGMQELPCRVFDEPTLDDQLYREIELIENIERKDLSWTEQVRLQKEINELMVGKHGEKISKGNQNTTEAPEGWSQRDTATLLGKSPSSVSSDIRLAEMMELIPQLGEAKNKSDATKLLKKLQTQAVHEELSRRIEEKNATGGLDAEKSKLINSYILRDCVEGIRELPDSCIDIVEIDPPYAIDLKNTKKGMDEDNSQYTKDDYNEIDPSKYLPFLRELYKECYRVMSDHSWLICWYAAEPWQEVIYQALCEAGFSLRRLGGIWAKPNGQTRQPNIYLGNATEPFYYARKGNPTIIRQGRSNVYTYPTVPATKKVHPTERPVELIQDVLSTFAWPGARILVPFLGSGNTLLAASNLKLNSFGFDLTKGYKDSFSVRVASQAPGTYSSLPSAQGLTFTP